MDRNAIAGHYGKGMVDLKPLTGSKLDGEHTERPSFQKAGEQSFEVVDGHGKSSSHQERILTARGRLRYRFIPAFSRLCISRFGR